MQDKNRLKNGEKASILSEVEAAEIAANEIKKWLSKKKNYKSVIYIYF